MALELQRSILLKLVSGEEGRDWAEQRTGWKDDRTSVCEWTGITCNTEKNVTEIRLPAADLLATIPTALGLLSSLEVFDLKKNLIRGTLPSEFTSLPNLSICNLASNQLKGGIPAFASVRLSSLDLSHNNFQGQLPPDFGALNDALTYIDVQHNFLSGYLPFGLERPRLLNTISFTHNQLSGTIPNYLGSLTALEFLYLNENHMVGLIPSEWDGTFSILKELWLQDNLLSGQVPSNLARYTSLLDLYLDGNKLTGELPWDLCDKPLNADFFEQMNSTEPSDYCDSVACPINTVSADGLYPCRDCTLPVVINPYVGRTGECKDLTESLVVGDFFVAQGEPRQDSPCSYEGVTCDTEGRVIKIIAPGRKLVGTIPDAFGYLANLQELDLSDNNLTGFLPSGLRFAPLEILDVSGNQLRGIVPPLLCNMDKVNGNGKEDHFECTTVVCPIGTYSQTGWGECLICNEDGANFLGSKICGNINYVSSISSTSNGESNAVGPIGVMVFLVVAIGAAFVLLIMSVRRYVRKRSSQDFEIGWPIDEDRTSFPHTEELKVRLQRLRRRNSPGQWLGKRLRRVQSYAFSFSDVDDVGDSKNIKVSHVRIDDYGWKEREAILNHRDIERAVETQKEKSSLTVWEYPDPLERDALSVTSNEEDSRFTIDTDGSNQSYRNECEHKEDFLDVPTIH